MEIPDTYLTISQQSTEILFKEKNSKFFGVVFPIISENEVKIIIENLKKQHVGAGHFCFAYQIGTTNIQYRVNDDGEPKNSAGMPIYGQIQSFKLTNILVVVIRYFGGVKLGVGGLISAYKTTAQLAIENAEIVEKIISVHFKIIFDYNIMNVVMRIIKEKNLTIVAQKMEEKCAIEIAVRQKNVAIVLADFSSKMGIDIIAI